MGLFYDLNKDKTMNQNIVLAVVLMVTSLGLSVSSMLAAMSGVPEGVQAQICLLGMAAIAVYLIDQYGYGKV